jgi:cytoskeletal protein RodZ
MNDDDKPNTWLSALKVILGAAVLIGTIGLALWLADQLPASSPAQEQAAEEVRKSRPNAAPSQDGSWGIVKDSPLRR